MGNCNISYISIYHIGIIVKLNHDKYLICYMYFFLIIRRKILITGGKHKITCILRVENTRLHVSHGWKTLSQTLMMNTYSRCPSLMLSSWGFTFKIRDLHCLT